MWTERSMKNSRDSRINRSIWNRRRRGIEGRWEKGRERERGTDGGKEWEKNKGKKKWRKDRRKADKKEGLGVQEII